MGALQIAIDDIGPEGLDLDEVLSPTQLADALGDTRVLKPAHEGRLTVRLQKFDDTVQVEGRIRVAFETQCSRCLAPTPVAIDTPLRVTMVPVGKEPDPGSEGEMDPEAMGVAAYENQEIDLAALLRDEVFLELPMNPLCSETCAGLCSTCGKDLNQGPCDCKPQADDRWQALKHIKLSS